MVLIKGHRVTLRDWKPEDVEPFLKWQSGPQEWKNWDAPYYHLEEENIEVTEIRLRKTISEIDYQGPRTRLVIADPATNTLIGTVCSYWISRETNWLAAGLVIYDPTFWSGGRGKEALTLWIDYLFQVRPELVRMDLQTWSGNEKMMRLAISLGFQLEGRFRQARAVLGQPFDSIHYGILRHEWNDRSVQS